MDAATSATETGCSNCLTEPSGSVIATIPLSSSRGHKRPGKKKVRSRRTFPQALARPLSGVFLRASSRHDPCTRIKTFLGRDFRTIHLPQQGRATGREAGAHRNSPTRDTFL
jgi:hypothetical protein